jgi:endonuclease YncB( thermonuclease family)
MTFHTIAIGIAMIAVSAVAQAAPGSLLPMKITGEAQVLDGETLTIGEATIRIWGIEAPAVDQTCLQRDDDEPWDCGEEAARALTGIIDGREITCGMRHLQLDEHFVADCTRGDVDIAAWMVRNGWALDRPSQSDGYYAEDQDVARRERAGLWGGRFELPWIW